MLSSGHRLCRYDGKELENTKKERRKRRVRVILNKEEEKKKKKKRRRRRKRKRKRKRRKRKRKKKKEKEKEEQEEKRSRKRKRRTRRTEEKQTIESSRPQRLSVCFEVCSTSVCVLGFDSIEYESEKCFLNIAKAKIQL